MAYYYYYQQQNTSPESLSPGTTATESTPPLPPLLLLSSPQQQHHINLPLLTPLLPSVTTPVPMTTTSESTENNQQQQQLPTPNTFIRHCDDMGLFHDLQNIVVMSSLNGDTTSVPVSTTATMVTTSASTASTTSNLFGLSSTAILTTMMMANPFDETFKQAVLQKQKSDADFSENRFSNNNNNNDELNTPFIATTTGINKTNNSTLTDTVITEMMTTAVKAASPTTVESIMTSESQPQQQSLFVTSSSAEATTSGVLVMMMEPQQQHVQNTIVSIQSKQHQKHPIAEREFIIPATTTKTSAINKTTTCHDQNFYNDRDIIENNDKVISVENEKTTIKQTLKHNLIAKQFLQEWQKSQLVSESNLEDEQHNKNIDVSTNKISKKTRVACDGNHQEDEVSRNQQLKQKQKQDLLERNRSAAKRCRIKRKQRWELLSEENRRLKIENSRLRDALMKLINQRCGDQPQ